MIILFLIDVQVRAILKIIYLMMNYLIALFPPQNIMNIKYFKNYWVQK